MQLVLVAKSCSIIFYDDIAKLEFRMFIEILHKSGLQKVDMLTLSLFGRVGDQKFRLQVQSVLLAINFTMKLNFTGENNMKPAKCTFSCIT